jgi:predicted methyltransferase
LHRIDEQFAKAELTRRGLVFVGSMQGLRNSEDDRSISVFDPAIRGKSDRFVHLYEKPIG